MASPDDEVQKKYQLVESHREGSISLRIYRGQDKEFWRLVRDTAKGPAEIAVGRRGEIEAIKSVFERAGRSQERPQVQAERPRWWSALRAPVERLIESAREFLPGRKAEKTREPPAPEGKAWYALVRLTALTQAGGMGSVVMSFDDLEKATRFRDANPHLALYPKPFAERPEKGAQVEVTTREVKALQRKGEGKDFADQFERLHWQAEQGKYFNIAHWNDRMEAPRLGQLVRFTSGLDYRGKPVDRLANPLGSLDPGRPESPQLVVFEMSSRLPGIGRVVKLPPNMAEAEAVKKTLNTERGFREDVLQEKSWRRLEMGQGLRAIADREMKRPPLRPSDLAESIASIKRPESEQEREAWRAKINTHIRGDFRADVIDQRGEDGERRLTVVLTHEFEGPDGTPRTAGAVFPFDELMSYRRDVLVAKEQEKARQEAIERDEPVPPPLPKTDLVSLISDLPSSGQMTVAAKPIDEPTPTPLLNLDLDSLVPVPAPMYVVPKPIERPRGMEMSR